MRFSKKDLPEVFSRSLYFQLDDVLCIEEGNPTVKEAGLWKYTFGSLLCMCRRKEMDIGKSNKHGASRVYNAGLTPERPNRLGRSCPLKE